MKGFTLIEVLVALVILSVGLLGLAGLQTTGIRNNHSANLRSQATIMAYDIADRIRANKDNVGAYAIAIDGDSDGGETIAESDMEEWLSNLSDRLPSGDGSIEINAEIVTIQVQWIDSRNNDTTTFLMTTGI